MFPTRRQTSEWGPHVPSQPSVNAVARVARVAWPEFYRDYVVPRRPAIVANATTWPAFERWSTAMFAQRFGDREVTIEGEPWRMADFIRRVEASTPEDPAPYLNGLPIAEVFPELLPDLEPSPLMTQPNWLTSPHMPSRWGTRDGYLELLIGGHGTRFPGLHYDQYYLNAFITQVVGDKHFILYRPEDTRFLYPRPDAPNRSAVVDPKRADLERFPDFGQAEAITVTLRQGETIFVPWGWWHITELPDVSVAVSINSVNQDNWRPFSRDFARRARSVRRLALATVLRGVGWLERAKEP